MWTYHDREDEGGNRCLDDPEDDETHKLDESEEVDSLDADISQVSVVRLVLGRHEKQLDAIHKLSGKQSEKGTVRRKAFRFDVSRRFQTFLGERFIKAFNICKVSDNFKEDKSYKTVKCTLPYPVHSNLLSPIKVNSRLKV